MTKKIKILNLYTDGSLINLRYGAYSYILTNESDKELHSKCVSILDKSIPFLELQAILEGLTYIDTELYSKSSNISVSVFSDSSYCVKCINFLTDKWSGNNWKKVNGEEVKYREEWKKIFMLKKKLDTAAFHVKSHTNIQNTIYNRNREVDKIVYTAAFKLKKEEDTFV